MMVKIIRIIMSYNYNITCIYLYVSKITGMLSHNHRIPIDFYF